ncbi:MAG: c-type cytochrome [Gammaproteobacteria bacterium]
MRCALKKVMVVSAGALLAMVAASAVAGTVTGTGTTQDAAIRAAEAWAFPKPHSPDPSVPKALQAPKPDMNTPLHVPGSTRTYTYAQLDTGFDVADWFPQDHPPMPHIVASGRKPAYACAACHKPGGEGYPSTASLAGLSKAYLREQLQAFRDGRRSNDIMPFEVRNLDAADEHAAVRYFSRLKSRSHEKVVETTIVPATHWDDYLLAPDKDGACEPLGERIIEVQPEDGEHGSERAVSVAYVPPGSVEAGAKIAAHGVGRVQSCESCHGPRLEGVGDIPYLAGRSPTYIVRELILFQTGKRINPGAAPMRLEASQLSVHDMIAVAAYAASRKL